MITIICIIFGLAPSLIWLLFFLRKDVHPESNRMIILVFLLGVLIVPFVAIAECIPIGFDLGGKLICFLPSLFENFKPFGSILYIFLGIAFIEELAKYLIVRIKILRSPEFDEPLDAPLYMIIAALGFAALENFLYLLPPAGPPLIPESPLTSFLLLTGAILFISFFRFVGATFLHALCSGVIGYFMAKSFFEPKQKIKSLLAGFTIAVLLHGLFNIFIMKIGEGFVTEGGKTVMANPLLVIFCLSALIVILAGLAIFVTLGFRNLKKMASICKLETKR